MFKGIIYLISGQKYYSIINGELVEDDEKGWTGLQNLYDHWNEIDWSKKRTDNATNKKLLMNLKKD